MVIRSLILLVLFIMPGASFGRCTKGSVSEPSLCPLRLQKISTIQIKKNGVKSNRVSGYPSTDCSEFKLDTAKVRKFFSKAKVVNEDEQGIHYKIDWAECHAIGTLKFVSGKKALWEIDQFGNGLLTINENNSWLLYCPTCNSKPFYH
jgi:hypothetical protein